MSGAAVLCARGALRGGAGLVRVFCPADAHWLIAASEPCLMTEPLHQAPDGAISVEGAARALTDWPCDVLAIGPGLGAAESNRALLPAVRGLAGRCVLDADALNHLAAMPAAAAVQALAADPATTVLTPHPGEFRRLQQMLGVPLLTASDDDSRTAAAHACARRLNVTLLLKGHRTVVTAPDAVYINTTGNPGMASPGMGDVLTGLIAALLAQRMPAFDAARLAAHAHGRAGDLAAERIGPVGFTAVDVALLLPAALGELSHRPIGFHTEGRP